MILKYMPKVPRSKLIETSKTFFFNPFKTSPWKKQMGISYKVLNDLLNGRRALTTATAMMFEAALGVPADSLMRLQLKYNMQQAMNDPSLCERLKQIRKYAALL